MGRGGRAADREVPERRCIVTGARGPTAPMIRFALAPDGAVVPDLAGKLPGRGAWVGAERALVERARAKGLFARAFKARVTVRDNIADVIEAGLARRAIEALGLARKAGLALSGFDKVHGRLKRGGVAALIEARDGAEQGRRRLRAMAPEAPCLGCLDCAELGLAFGREIVIHAVLDSGGAAEKAIGEMRRLEGFRTGDAPGGAGSAPLLAGNAGHG
jgi:predicted RNA-binding protein YlxR (DUF448 family)